MLQIALQLKPETEKQLQQVVQSDFDGSYEKFIETALLRYENVLSKLSSIAEDLGIEDLAANHDHYLYGVKK